MQQESHESVICLEIKYLKVVHTDLVQMSCFTNLNFKIFLLREGFYFLCNIGNWDTENEKFLF